MKTEAKGLKTDAKAKKVQPEENVFDIYLNKYSDCVSKDNIVYHICLILLNIVVMVLAMFWINNKYGVSGVETFKTFIDWKVIVLMISIFILIKTIEAVSLFISFYNKSRYLNFGKIYKANVVGDYFGKIHRIIGKQPFVVGYMSDTKIKPLQLTRITSEKKYFDLFAFLILSLIMTIVGAFAWQKEMNVIVTIACFVAIVIGFGYLLFVYMSKNDKGKSISICVFLSRVLAKFKLTKDEEKTYYEMIDKTLVVNKSRKIKWYAKCLDMLSGVATLCLRGLMLYLIFGMVGYIGADIYFKSLWLILILDIVKNIVPIPNEILLPDLLLFSVLLLAVEVEYIWFILLLYKVFENFIYDIHYLIVLLMDKFFCKRGKVVLADNR